MEITQYRCQCNIKMFFYAGKVFYSYTSVMYRCTYVFCFEPLAAQMCVGVLMLFTLANGQLVSWSVAS
jgi:hypothetical protein